MCAQAHPEAVYDDPSLLFKEAMRRVREGKMGAGTGLTQPAAVTKKRSLAQRQTSHGTIAKL